MTKSCVTSDQSVSVTPVKGGWIKRDAATGELRGVSRIKGRWSSVSAETDRALSETAVKRHEALKRLANR